MFCKAVAEGCQPLTDRRTGGTPSKLDARPGTSEDRTLLPVGISSGLPCASSSTAGRIGACNCATEVTTVPSAGLGPLCNNAEICMGPSPVLVSVPSVIAKYRPSPNQCDRGSTTSWSYTLSCGQFDALTLRHGKSLSLKTA